MQHEAVEEPVGQLLTVAKVSRYQLHRWQQAGLLPQPRQKGKGRVEGGSEVFYPPGSTRQAIRVRELLKDNRSVRAVRWRLWLDGYPIPDEPILEMLSEQLAKLERMQHAVQELRERKDEELDDAWQVVGEWARSRLGGGGTVRRIRKRTGVEKFATFILLLSEIGTGSFTGWTDPDRDPEILATGLGLSRSTAYRNPERRKELLKNLERWTLALSPFFDPQRLREALNAATAEQLHAARREVGTLLGVLDALLLLGGVTLGQDALDYLTKLNLAKLPLESQLHALLVWLSVRQSEVGMQLYTAVVGATDALRSGRDIPTVWESLGWKESDNG